MLSRRGVLRAVSAGLIAAPLAARAQQAARIRRVGLLIPFAESDLATQTQIAAFLEALQALGWNEGQNVRFDYRWAAQDPARIRGSAKELVELQPDVILTRTTPVTAALKDETHTIAIVFVVVSDPVGDGLVASVARPAGNVTGFTNVDASLGGKWLQLLNEIAPRLKRIAFMFDPRMAPGGGAFYRRLIEDAAPSIGVQVIATPVHDATDIKRAIEEFARGANGGLVVLPDVTTINHRRTTIALVAQHRLPAIYPTDYFAKEGGLISYGADYLDLYRKAASYVDRILRGARPAELPVQGPIKFQLAINLKTAKALGLTIPPALLLQADQVIQ
ncbi:MAG TPA: ABC transporter substrate-binding protein [Methylomirabilota bacterium]|nr:ABC transporter substrate-binding protein [Methylomirabilota bacterium]